MNFPKVIPVSALTTDQLVELEARGVLELEDGGVYAPFAQTRGGVIWLRYHAAGEQPEQKPEREVADSMAASNKLPQSGTWLCRT